MTGLAAGMASGFPVIEALDRPGGICASYERDGYTFEIGGGHWIFGGDPLVVQLLGRASDLRHYRRRSAVLFLGSRPETRELRNLLVPYPLQDNLWALPLALRRVALSEILDTRETSPPGPTLDAWLQAQFGPTLCRLFFDPFHERYTAGLFHSIAPQDAYKSPIDPDRVRRGAERETTDGGYNSAFFYPVAGLDSVSRWMAQRNEVRYSAEVVAVDTRERALGLRDGTSLPYERVVATAPLHRLVEMAGLDRHLGSPDPHTSVLVLNLGVTLPDTPLARAGYHWLYVPDSESGLHRVGYYSNVDSRFLPLQHRHDPGRASLYVETAFAAGKPPGPGDRDRLIDRIIAELRGAGLVDAVETSHPTWIDTAYTWRLPGSDWAERATTACRDHGIEPAGRYGRWSFQGIAASIREGLLLGSVLRHL